MIVAFPESAICCEIDGYTPMFYALCNNHQDVIAMLVNAYPLSLQNIIDSTGRLPLHMACQCAQFQIIVLLVNLYSQAVFVWDNNGRLPIHYATNNNILFPYGIMVQLIAIWPNSCLEEVHEFTTYTYNYGNNDDNDNNDNDHNDDSI